MEVWLLYAWMCALVYAGLLVGFHMVMEHQHKKEELQDKWERFKLWKEMEATQEEWKT